MRSFINLLIATIGQPVRSLTGFSAVLSLTLSLAAGPATGQQPGQETFSSPGEAVKAMIAAAKAGNSNALLQVFGSQAKELISSGDEVADKNTRQHVLARYDEMHRLVREPDGTVVLYTGAENWPFPIPLVEKNKLWYFDTSAGKEEILYRRIGKNELATIEVCWALVDAEKQYQSEIHDGDTAKQYAQKIVSDPGKHNGLYWKAQPGEPESPIGPLVAAAVAVGYTKRESGPAPFNGYIFMHLDGQGSAVTGGAKQYVVNGHMTGGFAFLAYPAEYRNSGVMTFVVNQDGIVYQKDLGQNTSDIARSMTQYNPDKSWQRVQD